MVHAARPAELTALTSMVVEFFRQRTIAGYLVGGSVRDVLLDRPRTDLDLAVEGDAPGLARELADVLGGAYVLLDEAHHVARVVVRGVEGGTITVDLVGAMDGIRADLLRRDFTVNALAVPLEAAVEFAARKESGGTIVDLLGGRTDLADRVLRAVQPDVFRNDPVRMLRAVRLAAEMGFGIAPETRLLILRDAALVATVAGERVHQELCRIFSAPGSMASVRLLDDLGVLAALIPEVVLGKGVDQPKEHHWDVFNHNVEAVGWIEAMLDRAGRRSGTTGDPLNLVPWAPELDDYFRKPGPGGQSHGTLLKLAALLHDIAKPQTKGPDATGRIRFLGHADLGAQMATDLLTRLRFGNKEIQALATMVTYHLRPGQLSTGWQIPTDRAIYRYFRDVGDVALDTLYLNLADHLAARGPDLQWEGWQAHAEMTAHVLERSRSNPRVVAPPRLITGHEVMRYFGLAPGPLVGKMVDAAREAQAAGEVSSRGQAIDYLEHWLATEQNG